MTPNSIAKQHFKWIKKINRLIGVEINLSTHLPIKIRKLQIYLKRNLINSQM